MQSIGCRSEGLAGKAFFVLDRKHRQQVFEAIAFLIFDPITSPRMCPPPVTLEPCDAMYNTTFPDSYHSTTQFNDIRMCDSNLTGFELKMSVKRRKISEKRMIYRSFN